MESKTVDVFVYGTLQCGGPLSKNYVLEKNRVLARSASVQGSLFSVHGSYPAISLGGPSVVRGEVHTFTNIDEVLAEMDRMEGEGSLYKRIRVAVCIGNGGLALELGGAVENEDFIMAWIYVWAGGFEDLAVIETGKWDPVMGRPVSY